MTTTLFERQVLAKPYFDQAGLIVATEDERPIAFAHAGFGPTDDESEISHELGAIDSDDRRSARGRSCNRRRIDCPLRDISSRPRCQSVLRRRHATAERVLFGTLRRQRNARRSGFRSAATTVFSQRPAIAKSIAPSSCIANWPAFARWSIGSKCNYAGKRGSKSSPIRRAQSWWEACTLGEFTRMQYSSTCATRTEMAAKATLIEMETFSHTWGVRAAGIVDVWVDEPHRRQGMAVSLLGEILRQAASKASDWSKCKRCSTTRPRWPLSTSLAFIRSTPAPCSANREPIRHSPAYCFAVEPAHVIE